MRHLIWLVAPFVFGFVRGNFQVDTRKDDKDYSRIRCPQCRWQPDKHSRWTCSPGCGHSWNTFETRGLCPDCGKKWFHTACLHCSAWSPHEDWYEEPADRR
jgi:predicted amidophosphoribosyltransferase